MSVVQFPARVAWLAFAVFESSVDVHFGLLADLRRNQVEAVGEADRCSRLLQRSGEVERLESFSEHVEVFVGEHHDAQLVEVFGLVEVDVADLDGQVGAEVEHVLVLQRRDESRTSDLDDFVLSLDGVADVAVSQQLQFAHAQQQLVVVVQLILHFVCSLERGELLGVELQQVARRAEQQIQVGQSDGSFGFESLDELVVGPRHARALEVREVEEAFDLLLDDSCESSDLCVFEDEGVRRQRLDERVCQHRDNGVFGVEGGCSELVCELFAVETDCRVLARGRAAAVEEDLIQVVARYIPVDQSVVVVCDHSALMLSDVVFD